MLQKHVTDVTDVTSDVTESELRSVLPSTMRPSKFLLILKMRVMRVSRISRSTCDAAAARLTTVRCNEAAGAPTPGAAARAMAGVPSAPMDSIRSIASVG